MKKKKNREIPIEEPEKNEESDKSLDKDVEIEDKKSTKADLDLDPLETLKKENEELKEKIVRKTAELDNAIKRSSKEKMEMIDYANEKLLRKLLEVYDDFTNAVDAGRKSKDAESIQSGIEMIYKKMSKFFEEEGVKPLDPAEGKPFDVELHDAMLSMPSDQPEGTVVKVIQNGYKFRDKVIRHAKVITSNGEKPEPISDEKEADNE